MTRTARIALTVLGALGAALVSTQPALADTPDSCVQQDGTPCVATQLPEEAIGSYRCPDVTEVVLALGADGSYVCGPTEDTVPAPAAGPAPAPAPVGQTPAGASAQPQPGAAAPSAAAPAAVGSPAAPVPAASGAGLPAGTGVAVPVAGFTLTDLWHQIMDWIRMLFGSIM